MRRITTLIRRDKEFTALSEALAELCRLDASSKSGGISGYGAVEIFITQNL